jgi:hypothetical protein
MVSGRRASKLRQGATLALRLHRHRFSSSIRDLAIGGARDPHFSDMRAAGQCRQHGNEVVKRSLGE